jgi:alpha-glucosidase (family GH31 glycosyl hydrolase)
MQAGLLQSHARIHGVGDREIYKFEPEVVERCREMLELRYRLLPYLWGTARDSAVRSVPMARALVVDFQEDPTTWNIGDQWLLGDALLVAPILTPDGRRRAYLPAGAWTDWWSGEVLTGPRWIDVQAPLDRVPLWIREGGIVALGPVQQHVGEVPIDSLEVRLGRFGDDAGPSTSSFVADVGGRDVELTYEVVDGRHELAVTVGGATARHEVPAGGTVAGIEVPA